MRRISDIYVEIEANKCADTLANDFTVIALREDSQFYVSIPSCISTFLAKDP